MDDTRVFQFKCPRCLEVFIKHLSPNIINKDSDDNRSILMECPVCGLAARYHLPMEEPKDGKCTTVL